MTAPQAPTVPRQLASAPYPWRYVAATGLLAAGLVGWSAAPVSQAQAGARIAVIIAVISAVGSLGQVAAAAAANRPDEDEATIADRIAARLIELLQMVAWPEFLMVAVLALEALHRPRPWHTAILGAAIIGFLIAAHMAESRADASVLRRQLPLVGIGLGLSALAVGAATLPSLPTGPVSSAVRIIAAVAGVLAAGLAVPVWVSRSH